jgi:hypothetical protein
MPTAAPPPLTSSTSNATLLDPAPRRDRASRAEEAADDGCAVLLDFVTGRHRNMLRDAAIARPNVHRRDIMPARTKSSRTSRRRPTTRSAGGPYKMWVAATDSF